MLASQHFKTIAKRANLPPGFTFHSLRHSCATFLIKAGVPQRVIMTILGHKNIRTAARYGVVLEEVARDALDRHAERLTRRGGGK
jgi:integrase